MPADERLARARQATSKLVRLFVTLVHLHASKEHVAHSDLLSRQIPASFAATAFNLLQWVYIESALLRSIVMWDEVDPDKNSIPTVVYLIDHSAVRKLALEEAHSKSMAAPPARRVRAPVGEPAEDREAIRKILDSSRVADARMDRAATRSQLAEARRRANMLASRRRLASMRNFRDKFLAHSIEKTWAEKTRAAQKRPLPLVSHGDDVWLLDHTQKILDLLHSALNGVQFPWSEIRNEAKQSADSLWTGVTIEARE